MARRPRLPVPLVQSEKMEEWNTAVSAFWRLYYGPLCLVEDRGVESAMVEFGLVLKRASFETRERHRKALENGALNLAEACRASIRSDWRIPLETLSGKKRDDV